MYIFSLTYCLHPPHKKTKWLCQWNSWWTQVWCFILICFCYRISTLYMKARTSSCDLAQREFSSSFLLLTQVHKLEEKHWFLAKEINKRKVLPTAAHGEFLEMSALLRVHTPLLQVLKNPGAATQPGFWSSKQELTRGLLWLWNICFSYNFTVLHIGWSEIAHAPVNNSNVIN